MDSWVGGRIMLSLCQLGCFHQFELGSTLHGGGDWMSRLPGTLRGLATHASPKGVGQNPARVARRGRCSAEIGRFG